MSEQSFYYLNDAAEFLKRTLKEEFDVARIFSLAEQGLLAVGFQRSILEGKVGYGLPAGMELGSCFFLQLDDVREFSPNVKNRTAVQVAFALLREAHAHMEYELYNKQEDLDVSFLEHRPLICANVSRRNLLITASELRRYISTQKSQSSEIQPPQSTVRVKNDVAKGKERVVQRKQEEAIINAIRELGLDPQALPEFIAKVKPDIKTRCWGAVDKTKLFDTYKKFDLAWERLLKFGGIRRGPVETSPPPGVRIVVASSDP